MAVKIPTYEDRLTPSGFVTPQARAPEISGAVGAALQNLGNAGVDYAAKEMMILKKKEDDDAIAGVGKTLSDATLHWDQYLKDASQSAADGAPGFTGKTVAEFDKYAQQTLAGITNPKAQKYAQMHFDAMRNSVGSKAINFEAQAGVADRDTKLEGAYQNYARIVAGDATQYQPSRDALFSMIANMGYDPVTRANRAKHYLERLGESALTGEKDRNPSDVKNTLERAYTGSFGSASDFVLKQEGGYVANDAGKGPTNFGINQQANPDVDVKNLTKDGAKEIYKSRYWDAIDGDKLAKTNPALATVAFDTAVNMGADTAKRLLKQANGDVNTMLDLRDQRYKELIAANPDKFSKFQQSWQNRMTALRSEVSATSAPNASMINRIANDVNFDRLPAFINAANTEATRQQAVYRSQVTATEGDHVTAYMNGADVMKPLTEGDYTKAYGPIDGPQRYANYQQIATMGGDISALKLATPEQMQTMADKYKPDPNRPGYELATNRYDTVLKAIDQVNATRQADPMAYAQATKIGDAKPLNFNDQAAFGAELAKRTGVASTMQQNYATPYALLTKAEATTLNQGFERMTTQQRLGYLNTIKSSISDPTAYRAVMQQIAPDSPVTAMAGMILSKQNPIVVPHTFSADQVYHQQDVAGLMLEGEALINPNKLDKSENGKGKTFPMPKEQDIRDQFNNVVGKAFSADPNGAAFAYQAVKAYYAGKAAREGDVSGQTNAGILKEAINAVIGGVTDVNGKGEVVRPWGMSDERFRNGAQAAFNKAIDAAGYKGSQIDVWGAYGLQSAGDSKYLVRSGTGYLTDKQGKPIVLDLTEAPNMAALIPTKDNPAGQLTPPANVVQGKLVKPNTQQPKTK